MGHDHVIGESGALSEIRRNIQKAMKHPEHEGGDDEHEP